MTALATKSPRQRLWLAGGALVAFLLLLVGYLALIGPQRADTASVRSSVDRTRSANAVLQSRISTLQAQNQRLSTYRAQAVAAMAALPSTSGVPAFLRTLQSLGTKTHTDTVSVTVGTPVDLTSVANGTSGTTGTAATTGTSTDATAAPAAPATPGVLGLPITAQVNGSPSALGQFLQQLQQVQPRAVLITQIVQGTSGGDTGTVASASGSTLQLTMQAFVAPGMAATTAQLASASGH